MSYKTIVVHLDRGERRSERIEVGMALAEAHDAYLVGLFALDVMRIPSYAMAEGAGPIIMEVERRRRIEAAQHAEQEFRLRTEERRSDKAEFRVATGDPVAAMNVASRSADLLIVGQPDPEHYEEDVLPPWFTEDVILMTEKPVLVVPYAGHFPHIGVRAMIAWDGGREAARAVWDGLPMLERAQDVEAVTFDKPRGSLDEQDEARKSITTYLGRHGVKATYSRQVVEHLGVGDAILSRAADLAADSIVMGAYEHSRLRERVFGGATRTVLDSMTVPVLMSH